jgi:XTP/dITP diphosphohydrolase
MQLNKLLIATGNKGKLKEFKQSFDRNNINIELLSLAAFDVEEPEENGQDFIDNALIKAQYYSKKTNLIALADDSGLVIDQLDGRPGIYSARWAGVNKDFNLAIEKVRQEIINKNLDQKNITASFHCVLCLFFPDHLILNKVKKIFFSGKLEGRISFPSRGKNGFGYDPIFIPNGYNVTLAEMLDKEKEAISHRNIALKKFYEFLATQI